MSEKKETFIYFKYEGKQIKIQIDLDQDDFSDSADNAKEEFKINIDKNKYALKYYYYDNENKKKYIDYNILLSDFLPIYNN